MAVTTMPPSPETPRASEPVLGAALRPGIVLLIAPGGAGEPWADDRALALLGCRDHSELAARWPAIRQRLLAEGLHLPDPAGDKGAESAAGTGAPAGTPGSAFSGKAPGIAATVASVATIELPPELTRGRRVLVAMVAMGGSGAASGSGAGLQPTPSALLLQDAELAAALESDLQAASLMRSLAQITPAVAHDLRAPINAMVLNLEVLKETLAAPASTLPGSPAYLPPPPYPGQAPRPGARDPRERQQRYVSVLREELTRLHQSLELFLAHVSPRGDRLEILDLRGPAQDLAALLRPPAHKQQSRIELLLPDAPVPVLAQRYQLRQALLHLGLAALERVPRDGTLAIHLERLAVPARACLRIASGAQVAVAAATASTASTASIASIASTAPATPLSATAAPATPTTTVVAPATPPEPRFSAAGTEARQQVAHGIVASFGGTSRPMAPEGAAAAAAFEVEFPLAESN